MPNNYFQFKQFTIQQDQCAMKVGTDGVLLGAWVKINEAQRILDIGTGSGCIPIALKKKIPNWKVEAMDISSEALEIAAENAQLNNVEINFFQFDMLQYAA